MNAYFEAYTKQLEETLSQLDTEKIDRLYGLIEQVRAGGKQLFLLGNGGSAAACAHWVCDFAKGANVDGRRRLRAFALSDSNPILTAYGNDVSYESVFAEQLKNYLQPGDLVISMSVSGSSPNLLAAHRYAQESGATCVSIIGAYDGKLKHLSDLAIEVPSKNYGVVEDIHLILGHVLSQYMKQQLSARTEGEPA